MFFVSFCFGRLSALRAPQRGHEWVGAIQDRGGLTRCGADRLHYDAMSLASPRDMMEAGHEDDAVTDAGSCSLDSESISDSMLAAGVDLEEMDSLLSCPGRHVTR